ncbi:hypothetical protein KM043_000723 [Ampulex compressa]|nr:hypothetical protein KM043_000723 [Ampulex compressa]
MEKQRRIDSRRAETEEKVGRSVARHSSPKQVFPSSELYYCPLFFPPVPLATRAGKEKGGKSGKERRPFSTGAFRHRRQRGIDPVELAGLDEADEVESPDNATRSTNFP